MSHSSGEFDLIRLLTQNRGYRRQDVLEGVGDDAAVVEEADRLLLFTCDAQVEGVHFLAERIPPYTLGKRLAAVNLSDIAAMGGTPMWALCSLLVGNNRAPSFYDEMYEGLYDELGRNQVQLIGGNVATHGAETAADLFLVGEVQKDRVLYRKGAKPGDCVCVTHTLGDSAAGLSVLLGEKKVGEKKVGEKMDVSRWNALVQSHFQPVARVDVGRLLADTGVVTACMDISDGLLQDAAHLAVASAVQLNIKSAMVPVSDSLVEFCQQKGCSTDSFSLSGGEDYELLFTIAESEWMGLRERVLSECGIQVTRIGEVGIPECSRGEVRLDGNEIDPSANSGFDHLKQGR